MLKWRSESKRGRGEGGDAVRGNRGSDVVVRAFRGTLDGLDSVMSKCPGVHHIIHDPHHTMYAEAARMCAKVASSTESKDRAI